jgi:hypothetical protein
MPIVLALGAISQPVIDTVSGYVVGIRAVSGALPRKGFIGVGDRLSWVEVVVV